MLANVLRLASCSSLLSQPLRTILDGGDLSGFIRDADAVEVHYLDEDGSALGDDLTTLPLGNVAAVAIIFHSAEGGLKGECLDVPVDVNHDNPDPAAIAARVRDADKLAHHIVAAIQDALAHERAKAGLSVTHLAE